MLCATPLKVGDMHGICLLFQIFMEIGTLMILQSDNGREFSGVAIIAKER